MARHLDDGRPNKGTVANGGAAMLHLRRPTVTWSRRWRYWCIRTCSQVYSGRFSSVSSLYRRLLRPSVSIRSSEWLNSSFLQASQERYELVPNVINNTLFANVNNVNVGLQMSKLHRKTLFTFMLYWCVMRIGHLSGFVETSSILRYDSNYKLDLRQALP